MATFYPSAGNQRDVLPNPNSGDQKLASFPDSLVHSGDMMMYLNQASSSESYSMLLPLHDCAVEDRNEMMFIPPTSGTTSYRHLQTPISDDPQLVLGILDGEHSSRSQGLSLSLGTQMPPEVPVPSFHYQYMNSGFPSSYSTHLPISGKATPSCEGDGSDKSKEMRGSGSFQSNLTGGNNSTVKAESCNPHTHLGACQYEPANFANAILNSNYLKETQQLLNEVVNVQKALKQFGSNKRQNILGAAGLDACKEGDDKSSSQSMPTTTNGTVSNATESNTNGSTEVSPVERQDLQNKKIKLLSMLDDVDKRYRQYYHQMQIVESSFDSMAGCGAAKPYTTLARKTISRHFRSLRNAISDQIQVMKKNLGEQETGIPRLRSVDRQQRALQHLGVMRHAWRPQRGLPETSVSALRAWLFEHFLHPYPNDSEKTMLARQTGLSRNQVANWFINARVRLWKPMVEEMYKEEFGGEELQENTTCSAVQPGNVEIENDFYKENYTLSGEMQLQDDQRAMMAVTNDNIPELNMSGFGFGDQVSLALGLHQRQSDAYPV